MYVTIVTRTWSTNSSLHSVLLRSLFRYKKAAQTKYNKKYVYSPAITQYLEVVLHSAEK